MAEGDDRPNEQVRNRKLTISDDSDVEEPVKLDIGVDLSRNCEKPSVEEFGASASSSNDPPRREDNPFSFKHFLRSDGSNYQSQGARPKVYCDGRPITSISDLDLHNSAEVKQTRIVPEFSSALPDFVQDHLVIEQCYLGKDNGHKTFTDHNNLPDFAPSRSSININRLNLESSRSIDRRSQINANIQVPLDLPVRPQADFPLDLPTAINDPQASGSRSCPPSADVGISKSLPDFLADGAVRTQSNDDLMSGHSPERDIDRLHQELEVTRRQLLEQTRRADILQRELDIARNKEHEYTQNLAKALEQVEDNLERSNRRAASAENTILKLRQEIKSSTNELNHYKRQNRDFRDQEGASGGPNFVQPNEMQVQRLAQELRTAASTAEHSLRQLLTGVDNLRIMASSLENMHRIEESSEKFLDYEEDAGPAL